MEAALVGQVLCSGRQTARGEVRVLRQGLAVPEQRRFTRARGRRCHMRRQGALSRQECPLLQGVHGCVRKSSAIPPPHSLHSAGRFTRPQALHNPPAVVSAMRGVMMRSMVGSFARLRNSTVRSRLPFSSKSCGVGWGRCWRMLWGLEGNCGLRGLNEVRQHTHTGVQVYALRIYTPLFATPLLKHLRSSRVAIHPTQRATSHPHRFRGPTCLKKCEVSMLTPMAANTMANCASSPSSPLSRWPWGGDDAYAVVLCTWGAMSPVRACETGSCHP